MADNNCTATDLDTPNVKETVWVVTHRRSSWIHEDTSSN